MINPKLQLDKYLRIAEVNRREAEAWANSDAPRICAPEQQARQAEQFFRAKAVSYAKEHGLIAPEGFPRT